MTTPSQSEQTPEEQMQELLILTTLVKGGQPRRYIERYFKIRSDAGEMVPMLFSNEPNQEYYYRTLREQMAVWEVDVCCLKDRKARWTSYVAAISAAKMFTMPLTHVFWVANAEDTFLVAHELVDGFYHNMPEFARPLVKGNEWGIERKVLRFPTAEGGELKSTFTLRTANNPNLGTSETPTDAVFDEYGKFPLTFSGSAQASFRASLPPKVSFWRGGTVGPQGPAGAMYDEWESMKRCDRQTLSLFRAWFENPANALPPGSRKRRPADMDDSDIVVGQNGGVGCDKEPLLVRQFPDDGIPVEWRLAQRRSWYVDAMLAAGGPGNEAKAKILFAREHCEDDETPWLVAGTSQFDTAKLETQIVIANDPTNGPVVDMTIHGLGFRMWREYDPTHVYIMGLDYGSGSGRDATSGQILDASAMLFVGEYHGNVVEPYHACAGAVIVMSGQEHVLGIVPLSQEKGTWRGLGSGVIVPETNRFPGIGDHLAKTLHYKNTWRRGRRPKENIDSKGFKARSYGFHAGSTHHSENEPSVEELLGRFKAMFNSAAFRVANPDLLSTMRKWNPEYDNHTPDRIAGARNVLLGLDMARSLQPVTGASRGYEIDERIHRQFQPRVPVASGHDIGVWGY